MNAKRKGKRGPSLNPQNMRDGKSWYYETRGGIQVYAHSAHGTTVTRIPWSRLMKSAERCGWKVKRAVPAPGADQP